MASSEKEVDAARSAPEAMRRHDRWPIEAILIGDVSIGVNGMILQKGNARVGRDEWWS